MKLNNKRIYKIFRQIYYKYPSMRSFIFNSEKSLLFKPTFIGGLLKTESEHPWDDNFQSNVFLESIKELKNLESSLDERGVDSISIETSKWRYWIVSFAVRYVMEFTNTEENNFVECGVADGFSSYIAMKEIVENKKINKKFSFHLYDSWKPMRKTELLSSEFSNEGKYEHLDEHIVKKNLKKFEQFVIYHPGYIPDIFNEPPEAPKSIIYLAIDLNSAKPTLETLKKFLPILVRGGLIIFDDYGVKEYEDTRKLIDEFLHDKSGVLLKLPTGQAIFFK